MCLDQESVIHKHLVKKIDNLDDSWVCGQTDTYWYNHPILKPNIQYSAKIEKENHKLTMLPSFHISLGAPLKHSESKEIKFYGLLALEMLVGTISLADIHISKTNNKKSAWISVNNFILRMLDNECETQICYDFDCEYDEDLHLATGKLPNWHISLANLTGNPHDSIARPENCIVDTITA